MTLAFSQKFKEGEPTYFINKIWGGILENNLYDLQTQRCYLERHKNKFSNYWSFPEQVLASKIHTIRRDKKDRWKVGSDIHFVINNRTKHRFQFAPILKCQKVQRIFIGKDTKSIKERIPYKDKIRFDVFIEEQLVGWALIGLDADGKMKYELEYSSIVESLAKNDGFDSMLSFFNWFSEDFEGKIIHWTDFSY